MIELIKTAKSNSFKIKGNLICRARGFNGGANGAKLIKFKSEPPHLNTFCCFIDLILKIEIPFKPLSERFAPTR